MSEFRPSFEQQIYKFMNDPAYRPMRTSELARELGIDTSRRRAFRTALKSLETEEKIVRIRHNRWAVARAQKTVRGRLSVSPDGNGMIRVEGETRDRALYVAAENLQCGLHRDLVEAEVLPSGAGRRSGEGRVVRVLERWFTQVVGLVRHTPYYAYVVPDNPRLHQTVQLDTDPRGEPPPEDHKVVVELDEWTDPLRPLTGRCLEDIGHRDAPGVAMQCIIRSHGYRQEFPAEVEEEQQRLMASPPPVEHEHRRDRTEEVAFTIDPDTARDFDDAISIREHPEGGWLLGVHIADVSHYVRPGSAMDVEAAKRGNSVYLVDRVIMMLPEKVTAELCSLKPDRVRAAHTMECRITDEGEILSSDTFPASIRSRARLTYRQVQAYFDEGTAAGIPAEVQKGLSRLHTLTMRWRRDRLRHGSIDLALPEVECRLDTEGRIKGVETREGSEAQHLVEECMLLANRVVARRLHEAPCPALYRVHGDPEPDQWSQMAAELESLGITDPPSNQSEINAMLRRLPDGWLRYAAMLCVLRNFQRAYYTTEPGGHFGLGFECYSHFTSPIRRYPDLLIHRLLSALEQNAPPPCTAEQLANLADHCSQTEREAEEAEKESVEQKRVEYYADQLRKGHTGPYRAHIVRFLKKGLIVELEESLQRGLVAFSGITDDFYRLNEERTRAVGRRGKKRMHIGEAIDVLLVKVDTARRWLDFQFADERRTGSRGGKGRQGSRGGTRGRPAGKKGSRGNKKGRPSKSRKKR
ncbi:ribonuclease R family protein [Kiritimatiella glycovorans]|uniref:Ribonuclease R n=1 Tax=Kiritimatiella glycovorans TaxID=1307763 RepID=A0A0G3ECR8_9BACT|nr:VacB/RNase II family 3'-5' exoribonuclease [Kiritimatiella glycovorans]AKJ64296.1 Ribonuclease R [Kiritimatiella glycovorans]